MVAGKRAEAQELAAKKEAEDMAAAQAVLGAGLKGYQQRKAARDERAKLDEGAKHIQAMPRACADAAIKAGAKWMYGKLRDVKAVIIYLKNKVVPYDLDAIMGLSLANLT